MMSKYYDATIFKRAMSYYTMISMRPPPTRVLSSTEVTAKSEGMMECDKQSCHYLWRQVQRPTKSTRYKTFSCAASARGSKLLCPTPHYQVYGVYGVVQEEGCDRGRTNRKLIHTDKYSRMILTVSHGKVDDGYEGSTTPILSLEDYWRTKRHLMPTTVYMEDNKYGWQNGVMAGVWQDGNIECLREPTSLTVPGTRYRRNN